jgi:hypothetical protein
MSHEERYVRVLIGVSMVMFAVAVPYPWAWLGLYPLATGFVGSSPLYRMLGIQRHHTIGA